MKFFFTTIFFFLIIQKTNAQVQNWSWAKTFGTPQNDAAQSSVTDGEGNTYVTGYYSPSGNADVFIRKYDLAGNLTWSTSASGTGDENATGITVDISGNIYITGYFTNSSPVFGSYTLSNGANTKDIFIAKYNSRGTALWAISAAGSLDDFANSITTDSTGNLYVAGYFESPTLTFGALTSLTNTGVADMFIAKYNTTGNILWARNSNGELTEVARCVKTDAAGDIYVTGYFYTPKTIFGTDTLINKSVTDPPSFDPEGIDAFLVKYNSNGYAVWARRIGGSEHDYGDAIAINGAIVYVGGHFSSDTLNFEIDTLANTGTAGLFDVFVARYDLSGNPVWAKSAGGSGNDYLNTITTDGPLPGNVYISGSFNSSIISFGDNSLSCSGNIDAFIAQYSSSGDVKAVFKVGGSDNENAVSVTSDGLDVTLAGYYKSTTLSFSAITITNTGNLDVYVAKLSDLNIGIKTFASANKPSLFYPNPSDGKLYIDLSNVDATSMFITVYDITGKSILNKKVVSVDSTECINLTKFGAGLYFVKLDYNGHTCSQKVVVSN